MTQPRNSAALADMLDDLAHSAHDMSGPLAQADEAVLCYVRHHDDAEATRLYQGFSTARVAHMDALKSYTATDPERAWQEAMTAARALAAHLRTPAAADH